jgi:uncharacterized membrane protein
MKKDSVRLLVIVIVGLLIYLTFFIEKVEDVPLKENTKITEIESNKVEKDSLIQKEIK